MRYIFSPKSPKSVIWLAPGRENISRPGREIRQGDEFECSREFGEYVAKSYKGIDGGPAAFMVGEAVAIPAAPPPAAEPDLEPIAALPDPLPGHAPEPPPPAVAEPQPAPSRPAPPALQPGGGRRR